MIDLFDEDARPLQTTEAKVVFDEVYGAIQDIFKKYPDVNLAHLELCVIQDAHTNTYYMRILRKAKK